MPFMRISPLHPFKLVSRRYSSTSSFSKLRAFPFKISPEDALLEMAPWASSACMFKQFLGSLGARYLPGFGFRPFLPVKLTPVYFPGWIIDAEAEVDTFSGNSQHTMTGIIHDSYLPGCDFRNLAWVSFSPGELGYNLDLVPFTEDLKVQYGEEVACLPHTISPFSALDIAHSFASKEVSVNGDFNLSLSTLKTNLFAAYPILFPLYLARYEHFLPGLDQPRSVTVFMEAWTNKGHIMTEAASTQGASLRDLLPNAPGAFQSFTHMMDNINTVFIRGLPRPFIKIASTSEARHLAATLGKWLDDYLEQPYASKNLAARSDVLDFDDDPRVRGYDGDERIANHKWMSMSREIASLKMIVQSMEGAGESGHTRFITVGRGDTSPKDVFDNAVKTLQEKIHKLEDKRNSTVPPWWKEWIEKSNRTSS